MTDDKTKAAEELAKIHANIIDPVEHNNALSIAKYTSFLIGYQNGHRTGTEATDDHWLGEMVRLGAENSRLLAALEKMKSIRYNSRVTRILFVDETLKGRT